MKGENLQNFKIEILHKLHSTTTYLTVKLLTCNTNYSFDLLHITNNGMRKISDWAKISFQVFFMFVCFFSPFEHTQKMPKV